MLEEGDVKYVFPFPEIYELKNKNRALHFFNFYWDNLEMIPVLKT